MMDKLKRAFGYVFAGLLLLAIIFVLLIIWTEYAHGNGTFWHTALLTCLLLGAPLLAVGALAELAYHLIRATYGKVFGTGREGEK